MLHYAVEAAFDDLLCHWRAYHDVSARSGATILERGDARIALDKARDRMHQLRVAMYPEVHELEAVVDSIWCETLDMVVHVRWADRDPMRPGNFQCVCGHLVPIDWDRATARS